MPYIKVDIQKLRGLESQLSSLPACVHSASLAVSSVRSGLDWDVACEESIDRRLRQIANELDTYKQRMQKTVQFVGTAAQQYDAVERGSSGFGEGAFTASATAATGITSISTNTITEMQAYAVREKKAKIWKGVVGTLCAIGSIAAIVCTGGAATPLVAGAITGTITAATNHMADGYVQDGDLRVKDWGEFGKDVLVGGCVGWVTGVISGGVSSTLTNGLAQTGLQAGLYTTNTAVRVGTNALIGSTSHVLSGVVARGTGAAIYGAVEGDIQKETIVQNALSPSSMAWDLAVGGFTGGVKGIKEPSFVDQMSEADAQRYRESTGFTSAMSEAEAQRYIDATGFSSGMSEADAARYQQRLSGNYNTYNTELVVADKNFVNQNAYDPAYGTINWGKYAPNGGAVAGSVKINQTIPAGTYLTRVGTGEGTYVAPMGTTYAEMALPYAENPKARHVYKVTKPISNVTISEIAPAFDQPGGGTQMQLPKSVYGMMLDEGALVEVK